MKIRDAAPHARRSPLGQPLPPAFYDREADVVARALLGCHLIHRSDGAVVSGRIVEVEAYLGPHDPACHSARGLTERNRHLHGPPGTVYVYLIYGMHWCVNAVTREPGYGAAVLIRAVEPAAGLDFMQRQRGDVKERDLTRGPGRLCQALGIDRSLNGTSLQHGALRVLAGEPVPDASMVITPRIGITRAAEWPLRFAERNNRFVSGPQALSRASSGGRSSSR